MLHSEAHTAENVKCNPKQKVIFAKTHKTGGTSVQVRLLSRHICTTSQNILFRTGEEWGLLFVLPRGRRHHFFPLYTYFRTGMAQTYGSKVQNLKKRLSHGLLCPIFQQKFSMFASHSRWDGAEVRKLVPNAFSLTILRCCRNSKIEKSQIQWEICSVKSINNT